jgi:hypothetical protein
MIAQPKRDWCIQSVRILAWLSVALFLAAFVLAPRGITVFWSSYILLFGPVIIVALSGIVGFVICQFLRRRISFAYLFILLAVMAGVWYVTWFELRLRWYELLH